ncbi:FG-GAP repeat domain-containing protein [Verrucomicrobium spinosum]|uniref:FG-GAP repeat domain-containing protein n=1 Tax=Verrucomicrobium spinosum TaxID=2736 RepID=UPI0001745034|nr:FG-GAP and VCBS repeat-containing protein [Verrucomicrobium spinosum]
MNALSTLALLLGTSCLSTFAQDKTPVFKAQEIDNQIQIGYGLAIADVQGDGKPDILLADKTAFVWYENPSWKKHVIAENLTAKDNVCIAARDIDGDGKCEIAVGAEWNPSDTVNSGAVFYLIPPADRTQKWEPVKLTHEPTTHRMKWVKRSPDRYDLLVVPLHGRGNKNGEGEGVKVLAYQKPADPKAEWKTELVSGDLHMTHNFDVVQYPGEPFERLRLGGKEGIEWLTPSDTDWKKVHRVKHEAGGPLKGAGEVREGKLGTSTFVASIEPMHGTDLAVYSVPATGDAAPVRTALTTTLDDGHALACADLLGLGRNQIVAGWRANANKLARVGIKMWVPDATGSAWKDYSIDDNQMACEDLAVADLDGDKKPDIIAAGRRTKNVKIYWNETP